jgi:hypothetical protein
MYVSSAQPGDIIDIRTHWPQRITITSATPAGFCGWQLFTRLRWAATVPASDGRAFQAEGQTLLPHYTLAVRVLAPTSDAPIRVHPETYARHLHHLAPGLLNLPTPIALRLAS